MAEANPIPELIEQTGLEIDTPGNWHGIPYAWANALFGEPQRPFAKYLFTFTDATPWDQWDQWGDSFVTEVIEPV